MVRVVFVHPDLGIGGAERLIVDAALALRKKGHSVHILTSHHDASHCFEETRDGSIPVTVFGDWLPRSLFGRFHALFAYIRMIYVAICLLICGQFSPDVIICDVISVAIPILKLRSPNVIFYCHFPDQLLSAPGGSMKQFYRRFIDWLEEITTNQASKIFVNSRFTSKVFMKTFPSITEVPSVLYPSLPMHKFDAIPTEDINISLPEDSALFLSLNRYERKKTVGLAVTAFNNLQYVLSPEEWKKCHLVIAGGYDENLPENVEHFIELEDLVALVNLTDKVTMLKSPSESKKISLIRKSLALLYTPSNEHFGIVPIESMYLETPVIAVNNGGPTETIVDNETGFLREGNPDAFADAMKLLVQNRDLAARLGKSGKKRVMSQFSFEQFARQLDESVKELTERQND